MTDVSHLDDGRFSALLDGMGDPADAAHAASCPTCAARLARWQAVAGRVAAGAAEPVPGPADPRRRAAVAAAIAESAGDGPAGDGAAGDGVAGEGTAGPRPARHYWRRGAGLAVAAAVVAAAGFGLSQIHSGSTYSSASRSSTAAPPTVNSVPSGASPGGTSRGGAATTGGGGAASAGGAPAASGAAMAQPTAGAAILDLGPVADRGALVAAVRGLAATPDSSSAAKVSPFAPIGCPVPTSVSGTAVAPSALVLQAVADYAGTPAEVFVFRVGSGHAVVVEARPGCAVLTSTTY